MLKHARVFYSLALFVICLSSGAIPHTTAQESTRDIMGSLRWRYIGPTGNRVTTVAGIPGEPNIYYVGAASGGIWKTIDGGVHWEPIFDGQPVSSIGQLTVAPSDPKTIWAC